MSTNVCKELMTASLSMLSVSITLVHSDAFVTMDTWEMERKTVRKRKVKLKNFFEILG